MDSCLSQGHLNKSNTHEKLRPEFNLRLPSLLCTSKAVTLSAPQIKVFYKCIKNRKN